MTRYKVTEDHASYQASGFADEWRFTNTSSFTGTISEAGRNNRIVFNGHAESWGSTALSSTGANVDILIGADGVLIGKSIVMLSGANATMVNKGDIHVSVTMMSGPAIISNGADLEFRNCAKIDGDTALSLRGERPVVVNEEGGMIVGRQGAIRVEADHPTGVHLVNHGTISDLYVAIRGGAGRDVIVNDGEIVRNVFLADGNDLFDGRGGTVTNGTVNGGLGDDVLITDNTTTTMAELAGQGTDTVKSSVSYTLLPEIERLFLQGRLDVNARGNAGDNTLRGNIADNVLTGNGGNDTLDGGFGDDFLQGGAGADSFGFATGYGTDIISDLDDADRVYIANWDAIANFSSLLRHARNKGDDVIIRAGDDALWITGLHKSDLEAGSFDF